MTDITDTLAPKSDQLDAVDLTSGPRTFTVESVVVNKGADQPVSVTLHDFPRVWRPGKNMRRVLGQLWGNESAGWTGRSVTLYCDPAVKFGSETVGGIRISHMSHIDGPQKATIIPTRGKSAQWPVKPLIIAPPAPSAPQTDLAPLEAAFTAAGIDQGEWLAYAGNVVGRVLGSPAGLAQDEVARVVTALSEIAAAQTGGE